MPCDSCGRDAQMVYRETCRQVYSQPFEPLARRHIDRLRSEGELTAYEHENLRRLLEHGELEYLCYNCGAANGDVLDAGNKAVA